MLPVDQTEFGDGKGNCWSACIASLLELPIEAVPNFCGEPERNAHWFRETDEWLQSRGLRVMVFEGAKVVSVRDGAYFILSGKSPRGQFNHAVVGTVRDEEFVIAHDPHPSRAGLEGPFTMLAVLVHA